MGDFNGTGGNWSVSDDHPQNACYNIISDVGNPFITVFTVDEFEAIRNAILISCAPELLRVLEEVVALYDYSGPFEHPVMNKAKDLISKAKRTEIGD